ncbi:MAG: iron transporter [Pseudomonadota bacterium]
MAIKSSKSRWNITGRTLLAIVPGYLLSNSLALFLVFALPMDRLHGVILGTLLTFVFWAAIIMWVFSIDRLKTAALGILVATVLSGGAAYALYVLEISR